MSNAVTQHLMRSLNNSRGVAAVMVALTMTVLLAMAAAALDIGHAMVARNELQNAADAGALAGARALGILYEGMTPADMGAYQLSGGDAATIKTAVQSTAVLNAAAGVNVTVNAADIQIGLWNSATRTLTPTVNQPRDVRVITRRDGTANGPVSTFLASVVGMTSVNVRAAATAELTALSSTPPGALDPPLAMSQLFFSQYGCGDSIRLYPSNGNAGSCAGFTTFNETPSNNSTMLAIINGMIDGTYTTPSTTAGTSQLHFMNGNLNSHTWDALVNLFNARKDASGVWDALVTVYQGNDCNPKGAITIVGYANISITNIHGQPGATIVGKVSCPLFKAGGVGGGPAFGVFSSLPGLVE